MCVAAQLQYPRHPILLFSYACVVWLQTIMNFCRISVCKAYVTQNWQAQ